MNQIFVDECFRTEEQYRGIVDYCEKKGWTILTNEKQRMVSVHFTMKDLNEQVTVKVHEEKKLVVINTILPVLCRRENRDKLQLHLQGINEKEENSYGYFQMDGRRIVYVYAYTWEGEEAFNEKAFDAYMDACMMIPYFHAEEIMDIATEHVRIPKPDPRWKDWDWGVDGSVRMPDLSDLPDLSDMSDLKFPPDWKIPEDW